jgi:copper chaperone CopZ
MKSIISIILLSLMIVSCQSKKDKSSEADLTPLTITMDVKGMTCNGCVETVRASVAQLGEGINSVEVSLDDATAIVEYVPAEVDSVEIRKAIELNGYKILGVKENEEAK